MQNNNCHGWVKDILTKPINKINKGNASVKHSKCQPSEHTYSLVVSSELYTKTTDVLPRFNLALS